ncbi:SGNH/GDSL hydrolase family protein [Streptomyces sp. PLAI1-29]|uniref:SGNH/GDSL hydrolase family protein n=1 Tax=Streptomyces zingiberis TaxID=2053010 RepID=A0ABX1C718_9ACTN|nr:SGNH/GDSL hydrolase family protein [Streptomyces zingiberis]NJQ02749.1 SGNH/GDSL hydrolase family protein [Streptomyces zingiberis]
MPGSRARVARRIAAAAAYGGGGAGLLGGAAVGLLLAEARWARHLVGTAGGEPPRADGRYGPPLAARSGAVPLRLGVLGDSTAAGQGVHRARETPGALLAAGLAAVAERPVELRNAAVTGAMSDDLDRQVSLLLADAGRLPDICVIMIGANDVTNRVPAARSVRLLAGAVGRLRAAGCAVVVGTCPDLGTIEPVRQPLRWVARRLSRQLAAAQTIAVVERGGRTVSLGSLLGPEFEANPRELFGPDSYHPSAQGYATAAMAVLPALCAALGLWPEEGPAGAPAGEARPGSAARPVLPVAQAAARAAAESGTEVSYAGVAPVAPGARRGPWAQLLRRRRGVPAAAGGPAPVTARGSTDAPAAGEGPATGTGAVTRARPAAEVAAPAPDPAGGTRPVAGEGIR